MSKYDPLTTFLRASRGREIRMSFTDVEELLGFKLPARSRGNRAWWSNNPGNSAMTKAWLAAGYKSAQVDLAGEKLTFMPSAAMSGFGEMNQEVFEPKPTAPAKAASPKHAPKQPGQHHPAYGALKGMITLLPDVDYTEPADPDWGKVYED